MSPRVRPNRTIRISKADFIFGDKWFQYGRGREGKCDSSCFTARITPYFYFRVDLLSRIDYRILKSILPSRKEIRRAGVKCRLFFAMSQPLNESFPEFSNLPVKNGISESFTIFRRRKLGKRNQSSDRKGFFLLLFCVDHLLMPILSTDLISLDWHHGSHGGPHPRRTGLQRATPQMGLLRKLGQSKHFWCNLRSL